jgi:hypothetical protein
MNYERLQPSSWTANIPLSTRNPLHIGNMFYYCTHSEILLKGVLNWPCFICICFPLCFIRLFLFSHSYAMLPSVLYCVIPVFEEKARLFTLHTEILKRIPLAFIWELRRVTCFLEPLRCSDDSSFVSYVKSSWEEIGKRRNGDRRSGCPSSDSFREGRSPAIRVWKCEMERN